MYDLIIVGAGPAGITAAVYAARKKINCLVLTKDIGGQAAWSADVENYTGYQFITGVELAKKFEEHIRQYDIPIHQEEEVIKLYKQDKAVIIETVKATYRAYTAIVASGKRSRELGVPGERQFLNRGVTYCASCDGPLFAQKDVVVIGGGNSALDAALQLVRFCNKVYILNNTDHLTGDEIAQEKLFKTANATVLNNTEVTAIEGEKFVSGIVFRQNNQKKYLSVQGVFIEIGLIPNSEFVQGVEKNSLGEIIVDCSNHTSVAGIFGAGDVTNVPEKQIIIAAGEGAKASLSVFRYLNQHNL
ncbi:MAG: FAD-dependent oxidoreductase [Candidatus Omnitrophica bacterium]|nr:FAD-dependent oxidoreductase [Candidatus Omnitrophota bacterium]